MNPTEKTIPEPVARTPIENWIFIRIDAAWWIPLLATCKKRGENHVVSSLAMERIIRTERPDLHGSPLPAFPLQAACRRQRKRHALLRAADLLMEKELFRLFLSQGAH